MTFLNDMWKKLKVPPQVQKDWTFGKKTTPIEEAVEQNEIELLETDSMSKNLKALRRMLAHPNEKLIDEQYELIKQHLGDPEAYEILRQERWPTGIQCPHCDAKKVKRIPQIPPYPAHSHRYQCLNCHAEFTDETGTPLEAHVIPLNVWLHCWYLCAITDSISFIASRLNLDYMMAEIMVEELKKFFQMHKPATNTLETEWEEKAKELRKKLDEDLIKQYETLDANIATHPKDTAEFRRQQNLRRTLHASTDPAAVKPNAKRTR
jgi:transposase-like protein